MMQLELPFPKDNPVFTRRNLQPYRKAWRKAYAALGGCDRGGWMQDLCLYYDLQWDVQNGVVGPTRYFIAPLILRGAFDCREIQTPDSLTVPQVYSAVQIYTRFYLHGPSARNWRRMPYRTEDIPVKRIQASIKAAKKFNYTDRAARGGKIHYAECRNL